MKSRVILERFSLALLILVLVTSIFYFVSFLAIETLGWVIFPRLANEFFYLALPLLFGAVFILSVFNAALNIGIIANSAIKEKDIFSSSRDVLKTNLLIATTLVIMIIFCLSVLYLVNKNNIAQKVEEVKTEMVVFVQNNKLTLDHMVSTIANQGDPEEVVTIIRTLTATSPYFRNLQIIYPIQSGDRYVYKIIDNIPYSTSSGSLTEWRDQFYKFIPGKSRIMSPNKFELDYLNQITLEKEQILNPNLFIKRPDIKIYYPLYDENNQIVVFLYSAGHQYGRNEIK